jgi:MFS family permease
MAAGKTIGSLLAGPFADRTDARVVLVVGLLCRVLAFILFVSCGQPILLGIASTLIRVGSGLYIPTAKAVISALSPADQTGLLLARRSTFANLGIVLGPPLGLAISATIGEAYLYWSAAAVFAALTLLHINMTGHRTSTGQATREYLANLISAIRNEQFVTLALFSIGFNFFHALFFLVMPIYGKLHVSESAPQIAYTVNALVVVASQLSIAKRLFLAREHLVSLAGFGLIALSCYVFSSGNNSLPAFVAGVVLYSLSEVLLLLKADFLASVLGRKTLGAIFSTAALMEAIGGMAGNKFFGALFTARSYPEAWLVASAVACVTAVAATYVSRRARLANAAAS